MTTPPDDRFPYQCPECHEFVASLNWHREDEQFVGDTTYCSRECAVKAYFRHRDQR